MERDVYKRLSKKDQAALVSLYETEEFKTLKKSLEIYQSEIAHFTLANSPDHEVTLLNRGKVLGARFIFDLAKLAAKKENEKRNSKSA